MENVSYWDRVKYKIIILIGNIPVWTTLIFRCYLCSWSLIIFIIYDHPVYITLHNITFSTVYEINTQNNLISNCKGCSGSWDSHSRRRGLIHEIYTHYVNFRRIFPENRDNSIILCLLFVYKSIYYFHTI